MLTLSQLRLAHRVAVVLTLLFTVVSGAQAAPELRSLEETPVNSIERTSDRHVDNLKKLYLTDNAVDALLQDINVMLRSHAFSENRIVDLAKPQGVVYQLNVNESRGLVLRTDDYRKPDAAAHSSTSLDVSGVDPYVKHGCDARSRKCWIADPFDATSEWITLAHEPAVVERISASMAELIKRLQQRVSGS